MSTATNLPINFTGWTDAQKQAVFLALAHDFVNQQEDDPPYFIGGGDEQSFLLCGPFKPSREIVLDPNNPEHQELKRRAESKDTTPLDLFFDELMEESERKTRRKRWFWFF